ncbi:MAG: penicillin-binding transpeptidase domain-containing protein [Armatimonas sp.]
MKRGGGTREVNLVDAIAHSSNVYFALAGIAIEPEGFQSALTEFGFSKVPSREKLAPGLAESGFGQGAILASPLEMAVAAGTIAAGGKRFPTIYEHGIAAQPKATPLTTEQAAHIAEGMRAVVTVGTARHVDFPRTVWGKTGTAQVGGRKQPHSWFIGYAKDPNVAFAVIVENGGYGARAAAPIASRLLR